VKTVRICSIASGSNGNAYYIEYGEEAILVDAGISAKQILKRATQRKIDINRVKAVFVSHEHSDHVRGLHVLCDRLNIPAYMTRGTVEGMRTYYMPKNPPIRIDVDGITCIGDMKVHSFSKPHDVIEPCSFRVECGEINIGVFTDIGCSCEGLMENLSKCHVAFLESNYDEEMLRAGKYPAQLKQRILSDKGHLSNAQAADIVRTVDAPNLHTLILSHLSADNNRPQIALKAFAEFADRINISTASRYEAGEVFTVTTETSETPQTKIVFPERLDRAAVNFN
jgi:phosphoribosyl 1,2-cyclic phosphodiesterase